MKATRILHQKLVLKHEDSEDRLAIFEVVVWQVPKSNAYPDRVKYRAWLSESGVTLFGFDNHAPKGPQRTVEVSRSDMFSEAWTRYVKTSSR